MSDLPRGLTVRRDAGLYGYERALRRAGLNARVVARPLEAFSSRLLPALLILNDGETLLLESISDDEVSVALPETGGGVETWPRETLADLYSGTAVFARPRPQTDERAGEYAKTAPTHWLKGPLRAAWPAYAEVGVAALAATTTLALVGNAVVCGVFANPHDRYGARMVWVATFVVLMALARRLGEDSKA